MVRVPVGVPDLGDPPALAPPPRPGCGRPLACRCRRSRRCRGRAAGSRNCRCRQGKPVDDRLGHGLYLLGLALAYIGRRTRFTEPGRTDEDTCASTSTGWQAFYASPLGPMAQEMIARRVGALWPHADSSTCWVLVTPTGCWSPSAAGRGRSSRPRRTVRASIPGRRTARAPVLVDEERLPFKDALFDRLIVCHGLEEAEGPRRCCGNSGGWRRRSPKSSSSWRTDGALGPHQVNAVRLTASPNAGAHSTGC